MKTTIIHCCWGALALVWLIAAASTKPTLRTTDHGTRAASVAAVLVGFCFLISQWPGGWLATRPMPDIRTVGLLGVGLTAIG